MRKLWFLSIFIALVACGVFFYLFYMIALIYLTLSGPANPVNDPGLQWTLRHVALPASVLLGLGAFVVVFRNLRRRQARAAAKVLAIK